MTYGCHGLRPCDRAPVTDVELLEKKLAFIETCVRELQQLSRPEHIEHDIREERFVAHTIQIAMQAALDIASHISSVFPVSPPAPVPWVATATPCKIRVPTPGAACLPAGVLKAPGMRSQGASTKMPFVLPIRLLGECDVF